MKRTTLILSSFAFLVTCASVYALYSVADTGLWPKTWPKEMESLRKQSRTLVGPLTETPHYAISFTERKDFEAAWPHILKVKSKNAPIILVRGPNFFLGDKKDAGVVIHSPSKTETPEPETPVEGTTEPSTRWRNTNYIELVVDGKIVDLNRIPFPEETPIIDRRFEKEKAETEADATEEPKGTEIKEDLGERGRESPDSGRVNQNQGSNPARCAMLPALGKHA